jgi:hypothetical protein
LFYLKKAIKKKIKTKGQLNWGDEKSIKKKIINELWYVHILDCQTQMISEEQELDGDKYMTEPKSKIQKNIYNIPLKVRRERHMYGVVGGHMCSSHGPVQLSGSSCVMSLGSWGRLSGGGGTSWGT